MGLSHPVPARPEFRALDGFQRAHLDAFGAAEEISFEQEALHREFLALLERTVERFVEDDVGASPGRFAAAVRAGLEARSGDAGEILDALFDLAAVQRLKKLEFSSKIMDFRD